MKIITSIPLAIGLMLLSKYAPNGAYGYHATQAEVSMGYFIRNDTPKGKGKILAEISDDMLTIRLFALSIPKWLEDLAKDIELKSGGEVTVVVGENEKPV